MTEKLYLKDSHLYEFDATVLNCVTDGDKYAIVLDKTAFFPEGGGQRSDTGYINDLYVSDVREENGEVFHYTDTALPKGTEVSGKIDVDRRFRRMQNHSGEHIVSGVIYNLFGLNNVGFHMGKEDITADYDGKLSREDLNKVEQIANLAVFENKKVNSYFPSKQQLENLSFRSKLDLTEEIRVVEIEGYDSCACCAPHVKLTGEIGLIKILDFINYKGGIRVHMLCGFDALDDYRLKLNSVAQISALLSVKHADVSNAVSNLSNELSLQKSEISKLNKQIIDFKVKELEHTKGNLYFFEKDFDVNSLRLLTNKALNFTEGICGAFSGDDKTGYNFVMASKTIDLKEVADEIKSNLNASCGGSNAMIQGNIKSLKKEIESFITKQDGAVLS